MYICVCKYVNVYVADCYNYYQEKILTFCGFKKFHPHDDDSIIRIAFTNKEEMPVIYDTLISVCGTATKVFENIKQHFTIESE